MSEEATEKRKRQWTPKNRTTTGFRISDELWAVLQPLLPVHGNTHRFGGGRPRVPDRDCADAIFSCLRAPGVSGKPSIRPNYVRTQRLMTAFKMGASGSLPQTLASRTGTV